MMKKPLVGIFVSGLIVMSAFIAVALPIKASAQDSVDPRIAQCDEDGGTWVSSNETCVTEGCEKSVGFLGFPTWFKYLEVGLDEETGDPCAIIGPTYTDGDKVGELDIGKAIGLVAVALVEILLRIASIVALAFVVYGGFRFITSQGEPDKVKVARQTIQNSLVGLIISIIATGVVTFITSQLT